MEKIKAFFKNLSLKDIIFLTTILLSFCVFCGLGIYCSVLTSSLEDQQAADRWSEEGTYAQASAFFAGDVLVDEFQIKNFEHQLEAALKEAAVTNENIMGRLYVDAYSAQGKITVVSEQDKLEAQAIGIGGDFFLFHPLELISGYYYSEDNFMQDRILIDEIIAWQLYGSSDIVGKPVLIGEKVFFVAGVYKQSDNADTEKVMSGSPLMFMPYQGYEMLGNTPYFNCYEACLPNPVTGLAEKMVAEALSVKSPKSEAVENSERYSIKNRFEILKNFGMRSVKDNAVVYPYWENAARITEDKSALVLVFQLLGLVVPIGTTFTYIIIGYKKRKVFFTWFVNATKRIFNILITKTKNRKAGIADE